MSFMTEKKNNYVKVTWPVKLCELIAKFYHSDHFKIDNVSNVIFSMKLELGSSSLDPTFDLWVQKSNSEPANALVKVMVGDVSINKSQFYKSSCYFKDVSIPQKAIVERVNQPDNIERTYHKIYKFKITCEIHWKDIVKSRLDNNNLYNEVQKFYNSEELSDVTIIVDNIKIPAHKIILAAHSEVFSKMLQSGMKEAKDGEINIKDLDPEIILEMLHYCYKGILKKTNDVQIALQMLKVADIYQIIKLKDICELMLIKKISTDNVINIIDVADDHNAVDLRRKAIEYIVCHKKVFASDEFEELFYRKHELMFEIIRAFGDE